jgi:hypothetical protein
VGRELAAHRGHLYLDNLTSITDTVAKALAGHEGGACRSTACGRSRSRLPLRSGATAVTCR